MALTSFLKDRGRLVRRPAAGGEKVDGTTQRAPGKGERFKCRLTLSKTAQRADDGGRVSVRRVPMLLAARRDLGGDPLDFRIGDQVEVTLAKPIEGLEAGIYQVDGAAEPLRKKSGRLLMWEMSVARLEEPAAERPLQDRPAEPV